MSQTANTASGIEDLGPDALLAALKDADRRERQAARDKLLLAYQWCVLHPATADTGVATWGNAGEAHLEADESLGGEGTPMVAAFAPEPLGLALGVPTSAAMTLIADALDLIHRLPHTWDRIQSLQVPAWRGRRVAQKTHALPQKAAAHVDRTLAPRLHTVGVTLIDRTIAQAIAEYLPDEHATKEERAKATWDVTLHHPDPTQFAGTSELHVVGDTMTLRNLYDQLCGIAADLKTAGDPDPLGARKAKALGHLAGGSPTTKVYLHVDSDDLEISTSSTTHKAVGRIEKLGPATLNKIRDWLDGSRVTIQPVLRMDRDDAADHHDPPVWMRDLVILRNPTCVFPHCQRDTRSCDLDHTTPYNEHGPPGQTRPDNLAPLCRRHHRAKTTGRWTYQRLPDGTHAWTGPGIN